MIERDGEVSVKRQAELLDLSRSSIYYVARDLPERDLKLMRILDELHQRPLTKTEEKDTTTSTAQADPLISKRNLSKQAEPLAGVNYFFRWRQSFLPVLSLHHWSTIAQSDARGVRSSVSEICRRFHRRSNA